MKFKPNTNVLFTCGEDGCFKSWALSESDMQKSSNWIYKSCNGYREISPSYISFIKTKDHDLIAVSFDHILTLWSYDEMFGVGFLVDLIHCDSIDHIKQFSLVNGEHLLVVHKNCLNLWKMKNDDVDLVTSCIWSSRLDLNETCVVMEENFFKNSQQLLIFIKKEKNDDREEEAKSSIRCKIFIVYC